MILSLTASAARRLRAGLRRRRADSELAALTDAQLRDIGLDRAQVGRPARELPLLRP